MGFEWLMILRILYMKTSKVTSMMWLMKSTNWESTLCEQNRWLLNVD